MSKTHGSPRRSIAAIASLVFLIVLIGVAFSLLSGPLAYADTDGAAMSLSVAPEDTIPCPSGKEPKVQQIPMVCVGRDLAFRVRVNADAIPTNGYLLAQVWVHYGDELGNRAAGGAVKGLPVGNGARYERAPWPDCKIFLETNTDEGGDLSLDSYWAGCSTGLTDKPPSFYKGILYEITLRCTPGPSNHVLQLLQLGEAPAGSAGALFIEHLTGRSIVPSLQDLEINCVTGPTPTPEPPIGGIALNDGVTLPKSTSGSASAWWFATALAALLSVAGTSAFVAVRRRSTH